MQTMAKANQCHCVDSQRLTDASHPIVQVYQYASCASMLLFNMSTSCAMLHQHGGSISHLPRSVCHIVTGLWDNSRGASLQYAGGHRRISVRVATVDDFVQMGGFDHPPTLSLIIRRSHLSPNNIPNVLLEHYLPWVDRGNKIQMQRVHIYSQSKSEIEIRTEDQPSLLFVCEILRIRKGTESGLQKIGKI